MTRSAAATPEAYLANLPPERRAVIAAVRQVVLENLPPGYQESMNWLRPSTQGGMICYEVPLERYPTTYNQQPLMYAALAAQKNYYSLYLNSVYQDPDGEARLREEFAQAGKKLNMGKSCLRFKKTEDLPLEVIGRVIAGTSVEEFIAGYRRSRQSRG
jgi:hypothetical protein